MKSIVTWYRNNGTDIYLFLLAVVALMTQRPDLFDAHVLKWVTFVSSVLAIAHKVFVPKAAQAAKD